MFWSFSIDVYVIFLYWNISMNCTHFIFMWLFTDVDIFSFVKCSRISILLLIIYWYWIFFICKMFLSFSIDVYVIFLFWNIWMNCTHFIFIGYLLMLTYFGVENVPEFQYCFWLFTDVDYLSCAKCSYHSRLMIMWFFCTKTYASIAYIFISWCFFEIFYACFVFFCFFV